MAAVARPALPPDLVAAVRAALDGVAANAEALFEELQAAVAAEAPPELLADPALVAEIERSNAAILAYWITEVARDPGAQIEPLRTDETVDIVRDTARRGYADHTVRYFRVGLEVASRYVLDAAFDAVEDPRLLRDALALIVSSASRYIDRSIDMLRDLMDEERDAAQRLVVARRLELTQQVLEAGATRARRAAASLGFELDQPMRALILWGNPAHGQTVDELERLAARVCSELGRGRPLIVPASATAIWIWLPGDAQGPEAVRPLLREAGTRARLAAGDPGTGLAAFRASHAQAIRAQRVMTARATGTMAASFAQLRTLELAGMQDAQVRDYLDAVLGELREAPAAVRETLRELASRQFDTSATARALGLHRNTVLARLRRAQELLPSTQERDWVQIGLALELARWEAER